MLASTMDRVTVKASDIPQLIVAFNEYAAAHPNSSIGEQAQIVASIEITEGQFVAWNQTSVGDFHWSVDYDEDDHVVYRDISDKWDLFDQFREIRAKEATKEGK